LGSLGGSTALQAGLLSEHCVPRMHTGESTISNKVSSSSSPWGRPWNPQGLTPGVLALPLPRHRLHLQRTLGHRPLCSSSPRHSCQHAPRGTGTAGLSAASTGEGINPEQRASSIRPVPAVPATPRSHQHDSPVPLAPGWVGRLHPLSGSKRATNKLQGET